MRFCLIDSDDAYREILRYHIAVEWPDATVVDYASLAEAEAEVEAEAKAEGEGERQGEGEGKAKAKGKAETDADADAEAETDARAAPTGQARSVSKVPAAARGRSVAAGRSLVEADAVLLAWPVPGETGINGLARLFDRNRYPPVVLFADGGDELLAVDLIKAGAASYFPKRRVTHQRLIDTLRRELGARGQSHAASLVGTHGQYRFIEELHSTEISTVFLAESVNGNSAPVAIKRLHYVPDAGGERLFDRFLQEYEIIARIEHPNVVRIFDLGIADDHAFIAMEYLSAGRLSDRLDQPLPAPRALGYLLQIAGALDAVHGAGILHRDLKPANIMFRDDDSIALIDFGLAKSMQLEAALTGKGQIFGTPYYMSPEQGHAEPTDARSDLYSLGCIFYELVTGQRPFTASTAMGVIYQHANGPRPKLGGQLAPYQALLERLVAVAPDDRFDSARTLIAAAESLATE